MTAKLNYTHLIVLSMLLVFFIVAASRCLRNASDNDEPTYTRSAKAFSLVDIDTTKPMSKEDSIKRQSDFIKHFNDTATFIKFERWLYKNVSGETHDQIINPIIPMYNEYLKQKYNESLKPKQ